MDAIVLLAVKFVTYFLLSSLENWQLFCDEILSKRLRFLHQKDLGCDIVSIKFYKAFDIEKPQFWKGDENVWYRKVDRWVDRKDEVAKKNKPLDLNLDWYKNFNIR